MEIYKTSKSDELMKVAKEVIPGAAMSNFRKDTDYHPIYMTHGKDARLYDVDGNEYIDYSLSYGPAILGHSNAHLISAIEKQARRLYSADVSTLEITAAQKVAKHLASAELVRFACSGTDANYNALRAARAYTGKNMFVRCNGHYHGGLDNLLGGIVTDPENPVAQHGELAEDIFSIMVNTDGRSKAALSECYIIEYNDLPALEKLFSKFGDDIAALLMEPTMVNANGCMPEPGYLQGVRELCTKHNVVLIFDEVLTAWRIGLNGAQGYFGVTPDMTTMAKALGGGLPVSSFVGKREIMDVITSTETMAGGTYNGHPLAMAAVIANIEELEKNEGEVYHRIHKMGMALKEGLDELARKHDIPLLLQGFPGAWTTVITRKEKIINHADSVENADLFSALQFGGLLKKRGVLTNFRFCTSAVHTEKDIADTLERAEDAMKEMKRTGV
ncbi:MAG: aspartate aminotransferase family protein [Deltaproteobacteria bacterium]|nr:aspartate aminotransferase family protein [Deltaproteobacteria bacterium]